MLDAKTDAFFGAIEKIDALLNHHSQELEGLRLLIRQRAADIRADPVDTRRNLRMHVLRKLVSEHMDEQAGSLRKSVGTVQQAMTGWARMNKPAKIELGKTRNKKPAPKANLERV